MSTLINGVRCTEDDCNHGQKHEHGISCGRGCICGRGFFKEPLPAARHMGLHQTVRPGLMARVFGGRR